LTRATFKKSSSWVNVWKNVAWRRLSSYLRSSIMTLKKAEESEYEVYILDTKEHGVSTAKSEFAEEHDVPYTRTSGDECLCVVVHSG
jgi:hypothetical protein